MSQISVNSGGFEPNDRKPRITLQDLEAIALYVARGMNETQAVMRHGFFTVRQWFNWKSRARRIEKYADAVSRLKAQRIDANLAEIEKASKGIGPHRPDWRAADRMLSIISPEQFAPKTDAAQNNTAVVLTEDSLRGILDRVCRQRQVVTVTSEPVKLLAPGPDKVVE